jgi:hypothetical protein
MFGGLRLLTWAIHVHVHGLGNVTAGGVHLHHYLYGILLVIGVALCGLVERSPRWHARMGLAFGIGLALIIDEAAELIELKVRQRPVIEIPVAVGRRPTADRSLPAL